MVAEHLTMATGQYGFNRPGFDAHFQFGGLGRVVDKVNLATRIISNNLNFYEEGEEKECRGRHDWKRQGRCIM